MVNMYQCQNCGREWEIDPNSEDNQNITSMGWYYVDECERCEDVEDYLDN